MERILAASREAIRSRGRFLMVLAGGTTPRPVYRALRSVDADWDRWRLFLGDERCVPEGSPERNDRMVRECLLDHVPIGPEGFLGPPAELGAREAACRYTEALQDVPTFDVVLLGLGEDGHTASLFPGDDAALAADAPAAVPVLEAPKPPLERVSLSAQRLNDARLAMFLVGEGKERALARLRRGDPIPAAAVQAQERCIVELV